MAIKYFRSYNEVNKAYDNIIEIKDHQKQLIHEDRTYFLYGKVARNFSWKAIKLIQIFWAIICVPLTLGLILTSENYKKFLSKKIEKIKNPDTYIYIQEQFQRNHPPLVEPVYEPENKSLIQIVENPNPSQKLDEKNPQANEPLIQEPENHLLNQAQLKLKIEEEEGKKKTL